MNISKPRPDGDAAIYEKDGKTFVAFGWGAIQVGIATDDDGQVSIHMSDVLRENPIGLDPGYWESAKGRTVVLGFNKLESLEVLADAIEKARIAFRQLEDK